MENFVITYSHPRRHEWIFPVQENSISKLFNDITNKKENCFTKWFIPGFFDGVEKVDFVIWSAPDSRKSMTMTELDETKKERLMEGVYYPHAFNEGDVES